MNAQKMAAQFAAYTWYEKCRAGRQSPEETTQFARENWTAFLSVAHESWGRLLIRMAIRRERPPCHAVSRLDQYLLRHPAD